MIYYPSTCDGAIYAVRDAGTAPAVLWRFAPLAFWGPGQGQGQGPVRGAVSWTSPALLEGPAEPYALYVGRGDGLVIAVDVSLCAALSPPGGDCSARGLLWSFRTFGPVVSSPAIAGRSSGGWGAGAYVIIASQDGNIYGLDARSGALRWIYEVHALTPLS